MQTLKYWLLGIAVLSGLLTACQTSTSPAELEATSLPTLCPSPPIGTSWSTRLQGAGELDYAYGVATAGEICAIFTGGETGSGGISDAYVTRYSTTGSQVWTQQLGTGLWDTVKGVAVDSEHNVYAVGYTYGTMPLAPVTNQGLYDAFLLKFDQDGTHLWTEQLGSSGNDFGFGIAVNDQDEIYIVGQTDGLLPLAATHNGGTDFFVAKYLDSGAHVWTTEVGTDNDEAAYGVALGTAGNVYVVGKTDSILNASDGYQGGDDLFVGKYRPDGSEIWLHQRGTSADEAAHAVAVNDDARVFVAGTTEGALDGNVHQGDNDIFVLRYNANGAWQWTDQRGTGLDDRALGVSVDGASGPYTVGTTDGLLDGNANAGGSDTFLMKHGRAGVWKWTEQYGSASYEGSADIDFTPGGYAYVVGGTSGDLGGEVNAGSYDAFALKYDDQGVLR